MEHRSCIPLFVRSGRVRHGCRWLQGQVVRFNPRHYTQYLQCGCKQLVECTLCASREGLPQVRYLSIGGISLSLYTHWPLGSCHTIADVPTPRYDFFQTMCKPILARENPHSAPIGLILFQRSSVVSSFSSIWVPVRDVSSRPLRRF